MMVQKTVLVFDQNKNRNKLLERDIFLKIVKEFELKGDIIYNKTKKIHSEINSGDFRVLDKIW